MALVVRHLRWLWLVAAGLNILAFLCAAAAGLKTTDLGISLIIPAIFIALALVLGRLQPKQPHIAFLCEVLAFISLIKLPFVIFAYCGAKLALPLWDGTFQAGDEALGLHWTAIMHWVDDRPAVAHTLRFAYRTMWFQLIILVMLMTLRGTRQDIERLLATVVVALILVIGIGSLCPALGILALHPHEHFATLRFTGGATPIPVALALRSGALRTIDLWYPEGLIVFPSFHAAMVVIVPLASRRLGLAALVFAGLDALMLVSAYTEGGHYVVDLIAGAAIGGLACWLVPIGFALFGRSQRRATNTADQDGYAVPLLN